ncbi:MAG TPA: AAA family ATPase [Actinomycetota bacterium]|nr:AAA family ATPase [Actinomycetota bacterium]
METNDLFIVTGAPGTGKTAVLDALGDGVRRVGEPAREILAELRAAGDTRTRDRDWVAFVDLLLRRSIEKHEAAVARGGGAVFDRGVPDCIAYAVVLDVDPETSLRAARTHRYNGDVLVLEPWEEIYSTDDERTMSFADVIVFHEALEDAYERTGYRLEAVPRAPVAARAAFVLDFIARRRGAASSSDGTSPRPAPQS